MFNMKLLGACCNYGQKRYGPRVAPYYIEKHLNLPIHKIKDNPLTNIFDYDLLYEVHNRELNQGKNIITIGGDHSISYSTITSALKKYKNNLHVVWIDAHSDINTQSTSKTHNLHGMPVGHLMGFEKHPIATFQHQLLNPSQISYIGIRDIDPPERERIIRHDISCYTLYSYAVLDHLRIKLRNKKIYLSIDLDSLDPVVFPCTGTAVKNGLFIHELLSIVNGLKENAVGMDIVEFDPVVRTEYNLTCMNQIQRNISKYRS